MTRAATTLEIMTVPSLPPSAHRPLPPAPPAAESPKRPESLTTAWQLVLFAICCELVVFGATYPAMREQALTYAEDMADKPNGPQNVDTFATVVAVAGMALSALIALVLTLGVLWLVLRGIGWARFVLSWIAAVVAVMMFLDVIGVVFGLSTGDAAAQLPTWTMIPRILGGVAALGASIALMHPDTKKYVDAVAAFRTRRRSGPGQGS